MPGPNTTGLPRTSDYNLGRGIIYFAPLLSNGRPGAYRDLGNAPEFNISLELETLEHQSSREGLKVVDKEVTISQKVNLAFSLDEINHENLAVFFSATQATLTNPSIAGITTYEWIVGNETSVTELQLGRWYDIRTSAGVRAYDVLAANLTLATTAGAPVTLVLNTDYVLDEKWGRVFFLSTSTAVATAIAAFQGVTLVLTARPAAKNVDEVRALTQSSVSGALKFISENPADNDAQTEFQFHQCTLKAEGDFATISDEFTTMGFTGAAERNTSADLNSPTLTIRNLKP